MDRKELSSVASVHATVMFTVVPFSGVLVLIDWAPYLGALTSLTERK